jgi:hypothetical protein
MTPTAITCLTDEDLHLWGAGRDRRAHQSLGDHLHENGCGTPDALRHRR